MALEKSFDSMSQKLSELGKKLEKNGAKPGKKAKSAARKKKNPPPSVKKSQALQKKLALAPRNDKNSPETKLPVDSPEMIQFFELLSDGGMVKRTCTLLGFNRGRIQNRVRRDPEFRKYYRIARRMGIEACEEEVIRRGYRGVLVPKNMGKEGVVKVREYSDQLLMFHLKASRPKKYRETKIHNDNRHVTIMPYDAMIQDLQRVVDQGG